MLKKNNLSICRTGLLCAFLMFFSAQFSWAQTSLAAGDIAIVGYNSSGLSDDFSFILLTNVSAGTSIHFTDLGWTSDGTGFQKQTPSGCSGINYGAKSDGAVTWTTSTALPCGTQIRISCQNNLSASVGSVVGLLNSINIPSDYMGLGTGGDQIFAFQGSLASPTLITGINMNGAWDTTLTACEFTPTKSILPPALGANAIAIDPEVNNAAYNCAVTSNSPANLRAAIFNVSNWAVDDATTFTLPLSCSFSCSSCVAPSISTQPANRAICENGNTTFNSTATGTGLSYQWQEGTGSSFSNLNNGGSFSGVTTTTLNISGAAANLNGRQYRLVVTGTCGTVTSNAATLTLLTPAMPSASNNGPVCTGNAINLSTPSVVGATYSWTGPNGFTSALQNPTRSNATAAMAGAYNVTVTTNGCTSAAGSTTLVMNIAPTANTDNLMVNENAAATVVNVLGNDVANNSGETLTVTSVTQPAAGGTATLTGGVVRFTPATNYKGTTSFTYTVTGSVCGASTAMVNVTVNANPLPVALIYFRAKAEGRSAKLEWSTASEKDNNVFELYRAADGKSFTKLGTVKGNGTTSTRTDYRYDDHSPLNGINYYRLIQVDMDGKLTELVTEPLHFSLSEGQVTIHPNPAKEWVTISFPTGTKSLALVNANGKVLKKQALKSTDTSVMIQMGQFPTGTYFVRLETAKGTVTQKVVKY